MTTQTGSKIERITGHAVAVHGDEMDTDRIIPARFLKTITFEGIEAHLFEDERLEMAARGAIHPIDRPERKGARIMIVQANFGCGSSREHAPQSIKRWGIEAIIGESFAEIFFGNAMMLGMPCVTAPKNDVAKLIELSDADPSLIFDLDLRANRVTVGDMSIAITMPPAARAALLSGDWDATRLLVERYDEVEAAARRIPYLSGWKTA